VSFVVCPDDDTHLKAFDPGPFGEHRMLMSCPTCGKQFMTGAAGVIEVPRANKEPAT